MSAIICPRGKQVWLTFFFFTCSVEHTAKRLWQSKTQGPFRFVHPAVCCVFVVLAAAGVKSVPILHLFLVYAVCLFLSQVVPVLYLVLNHFHSSESLSSNSKGSKHLKQYVDEQVSSATFLKVHLCTEKHLHTQLLILLVQVFWSDQSDWLIDDPWFIVSFQCFCSYGHHRFL